MSILLISQVFFKTQWKQNPFSLSGIITHRFIPSLKGQRGDVTKVCLRCPNCPLVLVTYKRSSPGTNLLTDQKLFSHINISDILGSLLHYTKQCPPGSPGYCFLTFSTFLLKARLKGKGKASSDLRLRLNFHRPRAYHAMWKLSYRTRAR